MIEASVSSFRGIAMATVAMGHVALVAGLNGQGKSSLAQAIAAVATGNFSPELNLKKQETAVYQNSGSHDETMARIQFAEGTATMRWPSCEYSTAGNVPKVSSFAAGFHRLPHLTDAQRAVVLSEYLHTRPSQEELKNALAVAVGAGPDDKAKWAAINGVILEIEKHDYDTIEKKLRNAATMAKGAWQHVTGRQYGSKIATEWQPEGFDLLTIKSQTPDKVQENINALKVRRDAAVAASAVSDSHIAELEQSGSQVDALRIQYTDATETFNQANMVHQQHTEQRPPAPARPGQVQQPALVCPCCEKSLELVNGSLRIPAGGPTPEEINAQNDALTAWQTGNNRLADIMRTKQEALYKVTQELSKAEADAAKAQELRAIPQVTGYNPETVGEELLQQEKLLAAIRQYTEATKSAESVILNLSAAEVLAPEGLRKKKLGEGLKGFNDKLLNLATIAGWQPVSITEQLNVHFGRFRYEHVSAAQKFQTNIMLQMVMAEEDASPLVVIDGADILDASGKNGLFKLLQANPQRHFLVCMTISQKEKVPNLAAAKIGRSYWVENGRLQELGG